VDVNWTKFALWAVLILVVSYAFNINIPALVGHLAHSLQQMHTTNGG
jgi:hypothetical protein